MVKGLKEKNKKLVCECGASDWRIFNSSVYCTGCVNVFTKEEVNKVKRK